MAEPCGRPLPASVVQWNGGLRRFLTLTRAELGRKGRRLPDDPVPAPTPMTPSGVSPGGPATTPFPPQCDTKPVHEGNGVGGADRLGDRPGRVQLPSGHQAKLALGTYHVTAAIRPV